MGLTDFGNMENTTKGIESTTKAVGAAMRQLSVAEMISSIATGIAKAQSQLDANGIAQFKAMADPANSIEVAGQKYNLIQLGFAPHFYHFQKITIEVSFDLKFHFDETQSVSLGAKLDLGASIGASRTSEPAKDDTKTAEQALSELNAAKVKTAEAKEKLDAALGGKTLEELKTASEAQGATAETKTKYTDAKAAFDAWEAARLQQAAAQKEYDALKPAP
ncbi:MAG: hypothetical protein KC486_05250 [Myxococcales bacterium]|nr:hypothetical protein [Myxococcales bacterium]